MNEGAQLLDALVAFLRRFVAMQLPQAQAAALWIVHSHTVEAVEASPYLAITSATKRSGKTRLLDVLELLVARPWRVITPSEAVVFRKIDADRPTLLLDEADAIFGVHAENHEGLRAILNAGNRKGTHVPRCVGPSQALLSFSVYCAKALAGIGRLPETVADRSIPIRLRRRGRGEPVERFRRRVVDNEAEPLYEWARSWAEANATALAEAWPQLPEELDDRAQDAWEPLLAIAEAAGDHWPATARAAALALSAAEADEEAVGVRLLADCRSAFGERDRLATKDLLAALSEDEEAPWATWHKGERRLSPRALGRLLEPFEIRPRTIRLAGEASTARGYLRESFADAWERYLPSPPETAEPRLSPDLSDTPTQTFADAGLTRVGSDEAKTSVKRPEPFTDAGCVGVSDRNPPEEPACAGDDRFPDLIDAAYQEGLVTKAEWLSRRKVHALLTTAARGGRKDSA